MTSISQPPSIPPQASTSSTVSQGSSSHSASGSVSGASAPLAAVPASTAARSYANATRKQASPPIASGSSPAAPVAVGSGQPAAQHAKSNSVSPVNGKTSGPPSAGTGPSIAHSNNVVNGAPAHHENHSRKSSVTISAAGATGYLPNGGPVAGPGRSNPIQFGSINAGGSPASAHALPQSNHLTPSVPVATPHNPRVSSPQTSPSPIPQPAASGGRPPSGLQGQANAMTFGSVGGDAEANRQHRPVSMPPQGPPNASGAQTTHLRRESSQSTHSDLSNAGIAPGPGRGGFPPQGGRGRGFGQPYPQHGQMGYQPGGPGYRGPPNQPRGNLGPQFQNQGGPMGQYPNSPHRSARSPALTHSVPGTPNMQQVPVAANQQMPPQHYGGYPPNMAGPPQQVNPPFHFHQPRDPFQQKHPKKRPHPSPRNPPQGLLPFHPPPVLTANLLAPENGFMEQYLITRELQTQYPYDPNYGAPFPPQQYMYPNMYMGGPPPGSPRPPHQQQHGYPAGQQQYVVGQYGSPQPQPMSRTSSTVSEQPRPGSSVGQPQTPSIPPAVANHAHHASQGRNSPAPATNFVRPTRTTAKIVIKDPDTGKPLNFNKADSSPSSVSRSPAIVSSTPTPPPSRPAIAQHARTESKSVKTDEEKKNDMINAIAKKLEAEKAESARDDDSDSKASKEKEAAEKSKTEAVEQERRVQAAAEQAKVEEAEEKSRKDAEDKKAAQAEEAEAAKLKAQAVDKAKVEAAAKEAEGTRTAESAAAKDAPPANADVETPSQDQATPAGLAAGVAKLSLGSGASTPGTDDSMGPPSKPASVNKRDKPAALNLAPLKTNTVEPPQPSAALQALRSARFIDRISDVTYPGAIASPNPALNAAATKGKFKYDKDFLLQFQPVFTEKPSIDWENKLQQTVGETIDSARPQSARTAAMGPRNTSGRPGLPSNFSMGNFGQAGNSRPVPATSAERFAEANRSMNQGRTTMNNPLAQFAGKPGGFQMGGPATMSRTNSSSTLQAQGGNAPNSPRSGNRSKRENPSKRNTTGERRPNAREEEQAARTMPLTAGLNLAPLLPSSGGWKPRSLQNAASATGAAGPAPGATGSSHMEPDMVQRKVKSNLNKMTPEKFEKIADQILEIAAQSKDETDGRTLRQVIQLTFEKATDEAHWASMYAKFCKRMLESMSTDIKDENIRDKNDNVVAGGNLFRKYLLNRCQEEFERGWKINLPDKPEGETEEAAMLSEEYYIAAAAKRRGLGLVQFIGELYKLGMLTERIMHECVKKLVDYEGMPDEAEVEGLTKLLRTIGSNLDNTDKGRPLMDAYFQRIQAMMETPDLPSRLHFMLLDIVDLRKHRWASKEANKGPQTIQEIHEEAQRQQAEKEAERARQQNQRHHGGGGGRMPIGRGDARSFSGGGQFGMQPPPDFQKNTVGMDDLRRLGSKAGSRQASQGGPVSLGPTNMFASRSNSGRKPLGGPGSALARGGEDSGASSRTTTPPATKEKDATTHMNAFSALATLSSSDDPVGAASPPSSTSSPVMTKAKPAAEEKPKDAAPTKEEPPAGSS